MLINAVIKSERGGTLVLDFPRGIYDIYEKLQSVGIDKPPNRIKLSDEDGDDVRVKLYAESDIGKHLILTLNDQNTLSDANLLASLVMNAPDDILTDLEQNIIYDQSMILSVGPYFGPVKEALGALMRPSDDVMLTIDKDKPDCVCVTMSYYTHDRYNRATGERAI